MKSEETGDCLLEIKIPMGQEDQLVELKMTQADLGHLRELLSSLVLAELDGAQRGTPEQAWLKARDLLERRRKRAAFFAPAMFGEAPWDILLALFGTGEGSSGLTIERLVETSGVPASSCKRWLEYLEQEQLVRLRGHASDYLMTLVSLTPDGKERMADYLAALNL